MKRRFLIWAVWLVCSTASFGALALPFSGLYVFGDSLSDSGNNFLALGGNTTPVPISGNAFIPVFPYASGRYTNATVWAEQVAANFGLTAAPSLAGGSNFAFGGATTGPVGSPFPFSLRDQVNQFLGATGGVAPNDALYVLAGGGNNVRAALAAIAGGGDPLTVIANTTGAFVTDIVTMLLQLQAAGADEFVLWTVPDVGLAPATLAANVVQPGTAALATQISMLMNVALLAQLNTLGLLDDVRIFDLFDFLRDVTGNPAAFGLANATDACAQFVNCDPSQFLFWDGIHPTSAGHALIAGAVLAVIPEPGSLALVLVALVGVVVLRRIAR